jgi:PAS domain S-box-containing protein
MGMADHRRVLIVDDDIDFADSLHDVLKTEDYLTHIANNLNDALTSAQTFMPHVTLLDIRLGQASGLDLLSELKRRYPHLLCIVMTAYANVETAIRALQYGAYDYLRKPVYPEELTATLHRCFEKIELEQQNQQAVVALQASEERFRRLADNANDMIYRMSLPDGHYEYVSPASLNMIGYTPDEIYNSPKLVAEIIHADWREYFATEWIKLLKGEMAPFYEYQIIHKSGEERWLHQRNVLVRNSQGQPIAIEGIVTDITALKQTEAEIRRRNRELILLNRVIAATATSSDMVAILDTACRELALAFDTPQTTALLWNEERATATFVADQHANDQPTVLNETFSTENNPITQYLVTHRTPLIATDVQNDPRFMPVHNFLRQRKTVSLIVLPLFAENTIIGSLNIGTTQPRTFSEEEISLAQSVAEQVSGALVRIRLDEQHRQLEEQFRQSQKMEAIGRLAGGMAHDFNNLLTVITGYSELLLNRHMDKNDPQFRDVEQIYKAGERASTLTRQLLAFSRQQVIQPEVLDLNNIITDLNKMLRRLVSEDIDLITNLDPLLGHIKADSGQMEQVIMNLVVNAADAMPQGGLLTIATANANVNAAYARRYIGLEPGTYVALTVTDTGVGMDPETLSHIYEPFFTTKAKDKGTGLGLATVYGIVQQNKGYISATSQVGKGTTFQIYLPRLEQAGQATRQNQRPTETQRGTETILLVEDEEMVRELARQALHQFGYKILEAGNGQEALQMCQELNEPIHLLLTDIIMPGGLNGQELSHRLKAIHPETKVLFMSGYIDDEMAQRGILDSDVAFLPKPFSPVALSLKVREILDS